MEADHITFSCIEEERNYWKQRATGYYKEWTDVKQEYEEYVDQSRQMEAELDATLEQKQNIIKDFKVKIMQLEKENEFLKNKVEGQLSDLSSLEKQLDTVRLERDALKVYSRQLEQKNDDLERAHRILDESIRDFERMLDKAYEKNAILELEVDEKEVLQEKLQRLMDETRDLKQELNVKTRFTHDSPTEIDLNNKNDDIETKYLNNVISNNNKGQLQQQQQPAEQQQQQQQVQNQQQQQQQSLTLKNTKCALNGNAINASSRNTALNIVADMLRKLNAMESKLNKYREHQHPRQ